MCILLSVSQVNYILAIIPYAIFGVCVICRSILLSNDRVNICNLSGLIIILDIGFCSCGLGSSHKALLFLVCFAVVLLKINLWSRTLVLFN